MATYPNTTNASDVWSLRDVYKAEAGDEWPSLPPYTFIFAGADEGNGSIYSITSPSGNERIALPNGTNDLCLFVADWTYQPQDANYAGGWDATIATDNSNADVNCGMAVFSNITYNQNTGKQTSSISMTGITVGSLLIYVANDNTAGTTIGAPSGFTTIYDHGTLTGGTTAQAHMSYKIADSTSESFSVTSEQGALLEYLVSGSTSLIASATYGEAGNPIVVTAPST